MITNPFSGGYKFLGSDLTIPSLGFADDLSVFSEDWTSCWAQHEWVRHFLFGHNADINNSKTLLVISDASEDDPRWLHSVDGQSAICPVPPSTTFRFLGVHTNMNLEWKTQISRMLSP